MKKEKILLDAIMFKHNSGKLTWKPTLFSDLFTCNLDDLQVQIFVYDTYCTLRFRKNGMLSEVRLSSKEYPELMQIYNALPIQQKQDDIDDLIDSIGDKQTIRHKKIESILEQPEDTQETAKKAETLLGRLRGWLSK
jgi:hypothetical protein